MKTTTDRRERAARRATVLGYLAQASAIAASVVARSESESKILAAMVRR